MKGLLLGTGAGVGMGVVLLALAAPAKTSGLAAPVVLRATSAGLLGIFMLFAIRKNRDGSQRPKARASIWFAVILTGFLDSSANLFFTLASRQGSLSVVSVLTALYPLGTIILARILLKEKIARSQMVGIVLALAASAVLAVA